MQLVVGLRPRVLLGDPGTELHVLAHRPQERRVIRQPCLRYGFQVQRDEPFPLLHR